MDLVTAMRTTGTCRYFRPDPVPDDTLYRAFEAARFAPQGGNRQPAQWIVVREPARKQALADLYLPRWKAYVDALASRRLPVRSNTVSAANHFAEHMSEVPVLLVLCAELSGLYPTDNKLGRLSVVGGASLYPTMQNVCLALRAEGVATAVTTLLCHDEPAVRELLELPDDVLTAAHVAVGYPERGFPTRLSRLPVGRSVSLERWGSPMPDPTPTLDG
jgi:nitroreductase